mmetsp:Transcript_46265/g.68225  ORF Transcript_46265/g.68225 Transcript_46265/m.68225 type:complete len:125 (+) Transcript_46265:14-388(+)
MQHGKTMLNITVTDENDLLCKEELLADVEPIVVDDGKSDININEACILTNEDISDMLSVIFDTTKKTHDDETFIPFVCNEKWKIYHLPTLISYDRTCKKSTADVIMDHREEMVACWQDIEMESL